MDCLIVDDDFSCAMVFKFMLEEILSKLSLTAVTSFHKAKEEILTTSCYKLFFIDMLLDGCHTGEGLIKTIRTQIHYRTVPIVIASSLRQDDPIIKACHKYKNIVHIQKPFEYVKIRMLLFDKLLPILLNNNLNQNIQINNLVTEKKQLEYCRSFGMANQQLRAERDYLLRMNEKLRTRLTTKRLGKTTTNKSKWNIVRQNSLPDIKLALTGKVSKEPSPVFKE